MQESESQFIVIKPPGVPPEESRLTPELRDFIKRVLVPILVDEYIRESKKASPDSGEIEL